MVICSWFSKFFTIHNQERCASCSSPFMDLSRLGRSGLKDFISSLLTTTSYNHQLIINLVRAFQGEFISTSLAWYHGHWIPRVFLGNGSCLFYGFITLILILYFYYHWEMLENWVLNIAFNEYLIYGWRDVC